jgi:SAM-dependent methyltransferase
VSQEAFLHVPDKAAALAEAWRILRPGGRLAFTDWIAHEPLSHADAEIFRLGMSAWTLQDVAGYRAMLEAAGFEVVAVEDLTGAWGPILAERFAMYRSLREEARDAGTPEGHDAFYVAYARLVEMVKAGSLGGGRFTARKPAGPAGSPAGAPPPG